MLKHYRSMHHGGILLDWIAKTIFKTIAKIRQYAAFLSLIGEKLQKNGQF